MLSTHLSISRGAKGCSHCLLCELNHISSTMLTTQEIGYNNVELQTKSFQYTLYMYTLYQFILCYSSLTQFVYECEHKLHGTAWH